MFALASLIPSGGKMAVMAAVVVALGMFSWHYTNVKDARDEALAQVGALQVENQIQDQTIIAQSNRLQDFVNAQREFQLTLNAMAEAQVEANDTAKELNDVLSEHDLTRLSLAKPNLIERRINDGTLDVFRMFESTTGGRNN